MTFIPISLVEAQQICDTALDYAAAHELKPLGIAILDHSGEPLLCMRQDKAPPLRIKIAEGKAYASWALSLSTRELELMSKDRPHFFNGINLVGKRGFVPTAGGILIRRSPDCDPIGAIGISGDTSDRDEYCAIHAIDSVFNI